MLLIEEIERLLVEQGEEVLVPTQKYCQQLYNEYNAHYFGNQLPQGLPILVSARMDSSWGLASASFHKDINGDYEVVPKSIKICSRRAITDFAIRSTMLHEMVHILDYVTHPEHFITKSYRGWKKVRYDAHGYWFMRNEISTAIRADGFVIERYVQDEQKEGAELSDEMKERAKAKIAQGVYAVIGKFSNGKCYFKKLSPQDLKEYKSDIEVLKRNIRGYARNGAKEFLLVKTSNQDISMSRVSRSSMKPINIDIENECEILQDVTIDGKVLKS